MCHTSLVSRSVITLCLIKSSMKGFAWRRLRTRKPPRRVLRVLQRIGLKTRFSRMHPFTNTWVQYLKREARKVKSNVCWSSFFYSDLKVLKMKRINRETEEEILKMIWDEGSQKVKGAFSCPGMTIFSSDQLHNLQRSQIVFNQAPAEVHLPESSCTHWLFPFHSSSLLTSAKWLSALSDDGTILNFCKGLVCQIQLSFCSQNIWSLKTVIFGPDSFKDIISYQNMKQKNLFIFFCSLS